MNPWAARVKDLAESVGGTAVSEWMWRVLHWARPGWAEDYLTDAGLDHPHRRFLFDRIAAHAPFDSVLEVGCASAPNLIGLSRRYPRTRFRGIDISRSAIAAGQRRLAADGIENVSLDVASISTLRGCADQSIDLVLTDAALIYVAPDRIDAVVADLVRIARRSVVLFEYHRDGGGRVNAHWAHDWRQLLTRHAPHSAITVSRLPPGTWPGSWDDHGHLVEARLNHAH